MTSSVFGNPNDVIALALGTEVPARDPARAEAHLAAELLDVFGDEFEESRMTAFAAERGLALAQRHQMLPLIV